MVNKKGFIRTMEAVIAILIVLGFLLYILPRRTTFSESSIPEGLESSKNYLLTQFLVNQSIRDCIGALNIDDTGKSSDGFKCEATQSMDPDCWTGLIKPLIDDTRISGYTVWCEICDNVSPCTTYLNSGNRDKSIYPGAIFMYFSEGKEKYVRLYFWKE